MQFLAGESGARLGVLKCLGTLGYYFGVDSISGVWVHFDPKGKVTKFVLAFDYGGPKGPKNQEW